MGFHVPSPTLSLAATCPRCLSHPRTCLSARCQSGSPRHVARANGEGPKDREVEMRLHLVRLLQCLHCEVWRFAEQAAVAIAVCRFGPKAAARFVARRHSCVPGLIDDVVVVGPVQEAVEATGCSLALVGEVVLEAAIQARKRQLAPEDCLIANNNSFFISSLVEQKQTMLPLA